ncbi:MAG: pyruvate kinase [Phycisphaerales bacterium]
MPDSPRPTLAKIVATLGPASESPETVARLIEAGVSVFRLNFSHGDAASHLRRLMTVRSASAEAGRPVAVLGDLCGPKIRVGQAPAGGIEVHAGQDVIFRPGASVASVEHGVAILPLTYPALVDEVRPGDRILIDDGAVRMLAVERAGGQGDDLLARVTTGGRITTGKGINIPDSTLSVPAITDADWRWVEWAVEHGLDFLALSFVRRAEEVLELKARLAGMCPVGRWRDDPAAAALGCAIPVVAKIEKPQALADLHRIVEAADAIMVARGDLGVEMDLAQVPVAQKRIVAACQDHGKPCIVATQMLETMIDRPSPTRAEVSDIANAIFDGADAVMLSAETAVGKYPLLAVETMRRTIAAAEAGDAALHREAAPPAKLVESRYPTAALAHGARDIAGDIGAKLIACWSQAGGTARYLSQNDFRIPIIAYTSSPIAARRMTLLKGVTPVHAPAPRGLGAFTELVERDLLARGWVKKSDPVVLLAGKPLGEVKATNSLAILYIGDPRGGYRAHQA